MTYLELYNKTLKDAVEFQTKHGEWPEYIVMGAIEYSIARLSTVVKGFPPDYTGDFRRNRDGSEYFLGFQILRRTKSNCLVLGSYTLDRRAAALIDDFVEPSPEELPPHKRVARRLPPLPQRWQWGTGIHAIALALLALAFLLAHLFNR